MANQKLQPKPERLSLHNTKRIFDPQSSAHWWIFILFLGVLFLLCLPFGFQNCKCQLENSLFSKRSLLYSCRIWGIISPNPWQYVIQAHGTQEAGEESWPQVSQYSMGHCVFLWLGFPSVMENTGHQVISFAPDNSATSLIPADTTFKFQLGHASIRSHTCPRYQSL